jgi:hypothetical protein
MMTRIREQMEKLEELKANGTFEISALEIPLPDHAPETPLEKQVKAVTERATAMIRAATHPRTRRTQDIQTQ